MSKQKRKSDTALGFQEILPHIATLNRRSLLVPFIRSGLVEHYLVNLFGEIIHYHGPGPHPHFALLNKKEKQSFDPWFLQNRLGIVTVSYEKSPSNRLTQPPNHQRRHRWLINHLM